MKVVVIKDLSIWVTQCGHGREALKISRSASKITFPVLSILRLKTLPNSIFPHYSTGRAKKSRSIKSWQLSRIRWFTAYLVFGRLGFWIEGRLFCSEGLVRLAKSKKRPRRSFASGRSRSTASTSRFHHLLPSFGHLSWKNDPKVKDCPALDFFDGELSLCFLLLCLGRKVFGLQSQRYLLPLMTALYATIPTSYNPLVLCFCIFFLQNNPNLFLEFDESWQ